MAYNEELASRIRRILATKSGIGEKKMFGGLAFLVRGHMFCGLTGDRLMVRVGPAAYQEALEAPHATEMDFTGRPLKGYVYVSAEGTASDVDLAGWVGRGLRFARTLPDK